MARLPYVKRADLKGSDLETYDKMVAGHNSRPGYPQRTELGGIYALMANNVELTARVGAIGDYNLNNMGFEFIIKEYVCLTVARQTNCQMEWVAHEPQARKAGVREECLQAIKLRQWEKLNPEERLWVDFTIGTLKNDIPDATFNEVLKRVGKKHIMSLVVLVAFTALICYCMDAFKADLNPEMKPILPIP